MMSMNQPVFYEGGGFRVTDNLLRTPRKTYSLARVEFVSVQRPLILFVGLPASGLIGFTLGFWRYLYLSEAVMLLTGSTAAIAASLVFGVLRVHSLALRDDEVALSFGPIARLRAVRAAVERAMVWRQGGGDE